MSSRWRTDGRWSTSRSVPTLEHLVIADSVSIDQQSNAVSIFHVFEEIRATGFPILIPRISVLAVLRFEPGELGERFNAVLRVRPPRGDAQELPTVFTAMGRRHRLVTQLAGVPIPTIGELTFELRVDGEPLGTRAIDVELVMPTPVLPIPTAIGTA